MMDIAVFFSPRWRWVTLVIILGMGFLVRLGFWQLDRLAWRRELNVVRAAEMNATPLRLNDEEAVGLNLEEMIDRPVSAVGSYDFENQFLIESQIFESQPGRYLLTPLLLDGSNRAVLVNRGWIPVLEDDFAQFDELGTVNIIGRIQKSQILSGDRKTEIDGNKIFRIDVNAAAEKLPYPVLPIYILAEIDSAVDPDLPYLPKADLSIDEGSHFSYALQWFSFAILLAVMYGFYVNRQES